MNDFIQSSGLPGDVVRFGVGLLVSFPLSLFYRLILAQTSVPVTVRHLYSLVTSAICISFIFRFSAFVELCSLCLTVYFLAFVGRGMVSTPIIIFAVSLAQMAYLHLENQLWRVNDPTYIDCSTQMMVLLIKTSSFGWSVLDGVKSKTGTETLNDYQKEHAIKQFPNLIEFLGYCFFFNGLYVGPAIEFHDYMKFIEQKGHYSEKSDSIPTALKCLGVGIAMIIIDFKLSPLCHFNLLPTSFFKNLPFLQKLFFLLGAGMVSRTKFYAVWKLSESAALFSGVGVGQNDFHAFENVSIRQLETSENVKACMDSWNKFTARWLRRYVYDRVPLPILRLPTTFLISAFWHGFYPGYYLSFLSSVALTESARSIRRVFRPYFLSPDGPLRHLKFVYDVSGTVVTMLCMNYLFATFFLRDLDLGLNAWADMSFFGHFLFIGPFLILEILGFKRLLMLKQKET